MRLPQDEERLWSNVDRTTGCWLWTAGRDSHGYAQVHINRVTRRAHRVIYELLVGPVPVGLELDHLCHVRHCVNPDHMEAVTHAENLRRRLTHGNHRHAPRRPYPYRRRELCERGHPFTPENIYTYPDGRRECRTCRTARRQTKA